MAQDFHAAFGYGESETAINMEDADGVALASIQGLYQILQEKDAQIADLEARLAKLEAGAMQDRPAWQICLLPGMGVMLLGLVWVVQRRMAR